MCLYFCITVVFYSDLFYPIWINQSFSQYIYYCVVRWLHIRYRYIVLSQSSVLAAGLHSFSKLYWEPGVIVVSTFLTLILLVFILFETIMDQKYCVCFLALWTVYVVDLKWEIRCCSVPLMLFIKLSTLEISRNDCSFVRSFLACTTTSA